MADVVERLRVVIEADGTATLSNGTRLSAEEVRKLGEQLDRTGQNLDRTSAGAERTGRQMASLGRDIAQGDWPGAAANMGRMATSTGALQAAASGLGATIGVAIAGVTALGVAVYQAREETERQANALLLTGNYAGLVGGQLNQMARDTAAGMNGAVGNTRQTMEALVSTGRVTNQSLGEMAKGVELVSRFSGQSREAVTKDFASMADGVAKWAAEHNQAFHYLTYEQYKYIESLEKAGQAQEAMRVNTELLNQHLGGDMLRNMNKLERGWAAIGREASLAWDKVLNIFRDETAADKVKEIQDQLAALDKDRQPNNARTQRIREYLQAELDAAKEVERLERRAADAKTQRAQEEEAKIAADREKKKREDDGTSTYQRLEQQLQRRLVLAQAEEEQNGRLAASERYRLQGLQQIADVEAKIGPQRAGQLRALVSETAEVLRNSEAREDLRKTRERTAALAEKEITTQERELAAMQASNQRLEEQIQQVGLTAVALARLKAERLDNAIAEERMNLVMAQNIEGNDAQVRLIERRIALLERQRALTEELGRAQGDEETRRKAEAENKKYAESLRHDLTNALQRAFADGKSPMEAFGAALENTIKSRAMLGLRDALMQYQQPVEQGVGSFFSSLFGGGGGGGAVNMGSATGADMDIAFTGYHRGGMVGSEPTFQRAASPAIFGGAPRFHSGGITGDEVPIIAKRGEGVFTPGQMKALGAGMGGGAVALSITVIDNVGTKVTARPKAGGNGMEIEMLIDAVDAGLADRAGAGQSRMGQAMAARFGLREAVN